ncbi:MAG TPA: hypothetical protein VFV87_11680 [Pirellulaceae bacterium]|nr:hypothetical protein [Pirellulaceae bacterium]
MLAKAAPAIRLIDAAQAKPKCVFITGLGIDALLPHAQAARTVTRLSVLQLQQARNKGEFAQAEAAVNRSLRLSRDLEPRGPLVCQLVSIAMDGMTFSAIERLVLTNPQLTAEQCDRLIALLAQHQRGLLNRTDEGLKLEYIMSRNAIEDLQSGRLTLQDLLSMNGTESANPSTSTPSPAFNYDTEITALNRLYHLLLAEVNEPTAREATLGEFRQEMDRLRADINRFKASPAPGQPADEDQRLINAPGFLTHFLIVAVEPFFDANRRVTAQLAGTQMLLALRRYEIAHGSLPVDLQTAAAESVLKAVPLDPYDGQPLRLATVGGQPTVYSVGKDLKDDGGQADWKFGQQPGDYRFVLPPRG